MLLGGILRRNLYEAPYTLPAVFGTSQGNFRLSGAGDPSVIAAGDVAGTRPGLGIAVLRPFDYGANYDPTCAVENRVVPQIYNGRAISFQGHSLYPNAQYLVWKSGLYYTGALEGYVNGSRQLGNGVSNPPWLTWEIDSYWQAGSSVASAAGPLPANGVIDVQGVLVPLRVNGVVPQFYTWNEPLGASSYLLVTDLGTVFDPCPASENVPFSITTYSGPDFEQFLPGAGYLAHPSGFIIKADNNGDGPYYLPFSTSARIVAPNTVPVYHDSELLPLGIDDDPALNAAMKNPLFYNQGDVMLALLAYQYFPGQALTPVLFDPQRGLYWPVQLTPRTADAAAWLAHVDPNTTMAYSPQGFLVGMSNVAGLQGKVFHTQDLAVTFPPFVPPAPMALDLPCYDPCTPFVRYT